MKENYELKNPPRKNPYAGKINKNGYSVAIHYKSRDDVITDSAIKTIRGLLSHPGVNAIHLYIENSDVQQVVTDKFDDFGEVMPDGRLTEPSDNNSFRPREANLFSKKLGRPLTDTEMESFKL